MDFHTLSLYLPSHTKLQCTLQLRGQIHATYFISTPICTLWAQLNHRIQRKITKTMLFAVVGSIPTSLLCTAKTLYRKWEIKISRNELTSAASFPIPTFRYLSAIDIFPGSVCLFYCSIIGGPIMGIYKSLTGT